MVQFVMALLCVPPPLSLAALPDDLAAGAKLAASDAVGLEAKVSSAKATPAERARLLGWYATQSASPDAARIRDRRLLLLQSLLSSERLFANVEAAVHREGDVLASADGYASLKAALLARVEKSKSPADWSNLVWFLFPEEPDDAIRLATENGLAWDGAVMSGYYLLGIGRRRYTAPMAPLAINQDNRLSPFGRSLLTLVKDNDEPLFQFAFGDTLRREGARLHAAGQLEWDYTALANESLARAAKAEPQQTNCGFVPAALPPKGATVPPENPLPSQPLGAAGQKRVTFMALIGCSGQAVALDLLGGPPELVSAAKRQIASRQFDVPVQGSEPRQSLQPAVATFPPR